jgi:ectoine hydroxylase-related dioxygenase (phytanoyl-CoA dioxygenase family)
MASVSELQESMRITQSGSEGTKVLEAEDVKRYERDGFIVVENLIDSTWIDRLRSAMNEFVDQSRSLTESNLLFDLETGHSPEHPRLRRLVSPADLHDTFWEFVSQSILVDVVEDLIGPDIKFHHSKLNFKEPGGGEEVKWHQDIQFWPHTNYTPLTVGVFLSDVEENMGNVGFVPGSHLEEIYDQYDGEDWVGCLGDVDVERAQVGRAIYPTGRAGSITVHNCRTVHGSAPNSSDVGRPLLLQTYAAADAFTYTDLVAKSPHGDMLIRGKTARWARHDPRPCQVGPSRVRTIFEVQQRE